MCLWVDMCGYGFLYMCSSVQLCVSMGGYVWLCVAMCECVAMCGYGCCEWLCVAMGGCVWLCVAMGDYG